jgi:hypothetical protein
MYTILQGGNEHKKHRAKPYSTAQMAEKSPRNKSWFIAWRSSIYYTTKLLIWQVLH